MPKKQSTAETLFTLLDSQTPITIKQVEDKIKGYQGALIGLDHKSKEYKETLNKVTKLQRAYNNYTEELKVRTEGGIPALHNMAKNFDNLSATFNHTIEGFQSAQQVMNAMGVEIGWVDELLGGLQVGLSISKTMSSFSKAISAGKTAVIGFNTAIKANPVMGIISAILAFITVLAALGDAISGWLSRTKELKKEQEAYREEVQEMKKAHDEEIQKLREKGDTEENIARIRAELHKDELDRVQERKAEIDNEVNELETKWKWWFFGQRKRLKELKKLQEELKEEEEQAIAQVEESIDQIEEAAKEDKRIAAQKTMDHIKENEARFGSDWKYTKEGQKKYKEYFDTILEGYDKDSKEYKNLYNEKLRYEREITEKQQEEANKQKADKQKYYATLNAMSAEQRRKEIEDLGDRDAKLDYLHEEIEVNEMLLAILKEEAENADSWEKKNQALEQYRELLQETTLLQEEEAEILNQIEQEKEEARIRKEQQEEERRQKEEEHLEKVKQLEAEIQAIKNPDETNEEEEEENENEKHREKLRRLEEEKAAALATANDTKLSYEERKAALDKYNKAEADYVKAKKDRKAKLKEIEKATVKATQDALAAATSIVGENTKAGKAMSVAAAIINTYKAGTEALAASPPPFSYISLATTLATGFKTVKDILKTDVPGTSDSSSGAATPSVSVPNMPELKTPIQETHNNMDAYDEDFFNQSSRVYVVESDITDSQKRVKVAETESAF